MSELRSSLDDKPHIIIADDDPSVRLLLKHILEKENFQTHQAENGHEVLAICEQHNIELILLDAIMPELSGFETCVQIKQKYPHIPVIIITSLDDDMSIERAYNSGADDYVTKPINWSVLKHRIKQEKRFSVNSNQQINTEFGNTIASLGFSVMLHPRINMANESITAVIASFHHLGPQKKQLTISPNTQLPLKYVKNILLAICDEFKQQSQTDRLSVKIHNVSGNPLQYVNMLNETFDKAEIPLDKLDCVFFESQLFNPQAVELFNEITKLPVNLHIGEFSFSLHSLDLIKSSRCNTIEINMPLLYKTLGNDRDKIIKLMQIYNDLDIKLIAADITNSEELTLARNLDCAEAQGPAIITDNLLK